MDSSSVVSLVAAVVSALSALASAWYARHTILSERLAAADDLAQRFREPLLQSAFNLQARLYNIVRLDFLQRFMTKDSRPEEREYAIENTLYLLGQYFCWVEIIRRESQFLDPRNRATNRVVADQLEHVRDAFASSQDAELIFRLFRGEQRAIGEVMLVPNEKASPGAPRWDCRGYAAFIRGRSDQSNDRWFKQTREDLLLLSEEPGRHEARLVVIQHALLDLVELLDPAADRVSARMRTRL